jgi:hypothetical protein
MEEVEHFSKIFKNQENFQTPTETSTYEDKFNFHQLMMFFVFPFHSEETLISS